MNVLLIGSGGREHALSYAMAKSPLLTTLFIAPGNPGMADLGVCVDLTTTDHSAIIDFCRVNSVELVVVGPEAPLVAGLADDLAQAGIRVFGPSKAAAQLEGSKDFTKRICDAANIPTAAYATFSTREAARDYLITTGAPIVVKYDGLMAGKGVTVAQTLDEALEAVDALYANEPAAKIVIEEMMLGEEASFFCLVDGETVLPFGSAQDHKRVYDGDEGPNTGGMGAYSPAPVMSAEIEARALHEIVIPSAKEMVRQGMPYRGVMFAGLMMTAQGPKLIEYNCRFGDPECQVLMLRLESDLLALLDATARGELASQSVRLSAKSAVGVVMATTGYPGDYAKGSVIHGLEKANAMPEAIVFHAGTRLGTTCGQLKAAGGRVLTVCATGDTLPEARHHAYDALSQIDWPEGFNRTDIAAKGLAHLTQK